MTEPKIPETWFVTLSVNGTPDLLTRPRYAALIARRLNADQQQHQLLLRDHLLLPGALWLLVQPLLITIDAWLENFMKDTADDLCESLRTDPQPGRKEWFGFFVEKGGGNTAARFWQPVHKQPVASRPAFSAYEKDLLSAPVKAGYVSHPDYYPYTSFNNRAGIHSTPFD